MTATGKLNHNQKHLSNLQIHTDSLQHQDFQDICLAAISKTKVDLCVICQICISVEPTGSSVHLKILKFSVCKADKYLQFAGIGNSGRWPLRFSQIEQIIFQCVQQLSLGRGGNL